jgi:hypothetical protein
MKKALVAILGACIALTLIYVIIGGVFDRAFWLAFLPGLMANLIVLLIAVFVIDRIFEKERWRKLEQINAKQSQFVRFLSNRMAYWLLTYLGLTNEEEFHKDKTLNLEFAIDKMKIVDVADTFYEKLTNSADRETFLDGFIKHVREGLEGILKALDAIYPHPDPAAKQLADEMMYSNGVLEAFKGMFGIIKEANERVAAGQGFNPEQIELLIKIAYSPVARELQKLQATVVELSSRADANKLFASLD